jgi:hypothetical protein
MQGVHERLLSRRRTGKETSAIVCNAFVAFYLVSLLTVKPTRKINRMNRIKENSAVNILIF